MSDKISHGGSAISTTEFEVREIDQFGDAISVNYFLKKNEAIAVAEKMIAAGAKAVAVEKHISRSPAFLFKEPDRFETVAVAGCKTALAAWGHNVL